MYTVLMAIIGILVGFCVSTLYGNVRQFIIQIKVLKHDSFSIQMWLVLSKLTMNHETLTTFINTFIYRLFDSSKLFWNTNCTLIRLWFLFLQCSRIHLSYLLSKNIFIVTDFFNNLIWILFAKSKIPVKRQYNLNNT